jgi:hypothetical protein
MIDVGEETMWAYLAQFDADFAPHGTPPRESVIFNGIYSLKFPDGSHRTFKIHTKGGRGALAGKRIISLLARADDDDEDSYVGFGFVDNHGIHLWKNGRHQFHQHAALIWKLATGESIDGHELLVSRRCLACNRPLTTPESIERGLGDFCAKKLGR